MVRLPLSRKIVSVRETYVFGKAPERTTIPGRIGRATGYLFPSHDPELCAKDIYQDIFSSGRFKYGYHRQNGQDMFLNRWFFTDRGPSFFIDVGAFNGVLGSNRAYFEKQLKRKGVAFEPGNDSGKVNIIGLEQSGRFPEVYRLMTTSCFEYQGLLFFDEFFVHKHPCYSWDVSTQIR